jgi:putative transposase
VDSARYVLGCYRYIERNPVRASMVDSAAKYPWSSHAANAGGSDDNLLSPHPEYLALGNETETRRLAYRELFAAADDVEFLRQVRDATEGDFPLLGDKMREQLAQVAKPPLERRKRGPRSSEESVQDSLELPFCGN